MNTPIPEQTLEQIKSAIFARRKIEAIKLLREATGLGLAESKQWVDNLTTELETNEPDKFTAPKAGCSTALFVVSLLGVIVLLRWI